jgi:predicted transcriptional regulator
MPPTKPLFKDNPARVVRDALIIEKRLEGKSQRAVAEEVGVSQDTVKRTLKDDDYKDIIDRSTKEMIELMPKAVDNVNGFLVSDNEQYRYKASTFILEKIWKEDKHTENPVIQQYFNQTNISVIPPTISKLLDLKADEMTCIDLQQPPEKSKNIQ